MKKEKGIIYFLFYTLYKKGKLRCLFDKMTSEMLKRQEEVWRPVKRGLKPSKFFETLKTSTFD